MAARQLVLSLSQALGTNQLEQLDTLHTIAQRFEIVTPYSSMIVLVNDRQKEALQKATAMRDRYHREVESGQEQLSQPSDPLTVSGVPEPEEWMLMGLAGIALLVVAQRRKSGRSHPLP